MKNETMICIPGPWKDQAAFAQSVALQSNGAFTFAGRILAQPEANDQITLEFSEPYTEMRQAFEMAGQDTLTPEVLDQIESHQSAVYLRFPLDVVTQHKRMLTYTTLMREIGGYAVKIESSGIAHNWEDWQDLIASDNPSYLYRCFVMLIGDKEEFHSCGMSDLKENAARRSRKHLEPIQLLPDHRQTRPEGRAHLQPIGRFPHLSTKPHRRLATQRRRFLQKHKRTLDPGTRCNIRLRPLLRTSQEVAQETEDNQGTARTSGASRLLFPWRTRLCRAASTNSHLRISPRRS
jgi:hypothetical protein